MTKSKLEVLAIFLGEELENINISSYDENIFEIGNQEYLILTDEEADEKTKEYILDSLWAFNASFIIEHMASRDELSNHNYKMMEKALELIQSDLCESANVVMQRLIEDIDEFVDDAIKADGRGHFLSGYDGNENEEEGYFIYRVN